MWMLITVLIFCWLVASSSYGGARLGVRSMLKEWKEQQRRPECEICSRPADIMTTYIEHSGNVRRVSLCGKCFMEDKELSDAE